MTIVLEGDLQHEGAPPQVLDKATRFEGFVIDVLGIQGNIYFESVGRRWSITVDQSYSSGGQIITTIKEIDL